MCHTDDSEKGLCVYEIQYKYANGVCVSAFQMRMN
jgi:hypothetical protein